MIHQSTIEIKHSLIQKFCLLVVMAASFVPLFTDYFSWLLGFGFKIHHEDLEHSFFNSLMNAK